MNAEEYTRMYELEERYWWFVGRRNLALRLLKGALGSGHWAPGSEGSLGSPVQRPTTNNQRPTILDIGCGTGVVSRELAEWSNPISLDMSELALTLCKPRGLTGLLLADGIALPMQTGSVEAVIGLDVFEHIEDDEKAFAETFRVLRPGGVLVLSVPAFRSLWGPHDVALSHYRRYRAREIRVKLERAGFQLDKLSYSVFFLFPVVVVVRIFEKMKRGSPKASLVRVPKTLNRMLIALQNGEASIIAKGRLPWGSSVVAVARKIR